MIQLKRVKENPILTPSKQSWENMLVFNPGAVISNGKILLIYRATGQSDQVSRLGFAESTDGIHFKRNIYPIYYGGLHEHEALGIEDPRVVKIGKTFYIVYTAVSEHKMAIVNPAWKEQIAKKAHVALSTTTDFVHYLDYDVIIPKTPSKNGTLFPKKNKDEYWLLYREGSGTTFFANSPRLDYWPEMYPVFGKRPGHWDSIRVGVGAPPLDTEKGWLLFYHGVDEKNIYRIGVMFLDHNNPRKV